MYYRALRKKKSHPEADCIGEGAAPAPPHLNVAGAAWGVQSCGNKYHLRGAIHNMQVANIEMWGCGG